MIKPIPKTQDRLRHNNYSIVLRRCLERLARFCECLSMCQEAFPL